MMHAREGALSFASQRQRFFGAIAARIGENVAFTSLDGPMRNLSQVGHRRKWRVASFVTLLTTLTAHGIWVHRRPEKVMPSRILGPADPAAQGMSCQNSN